MITTVATMISRWLTGPRILARMVVVTKVTMPCAPAQKDCSKPQSRSQRIIFAHKMSHNNVRPAEIEAMMVMMLVEYDVVDDDVWDAHDDGSDG